MPTRDMSEATLNTILTVMHKTTGEHHIPVAFEHPNVVVHDYVGTRVDMGELKRCIAHFASVHTGVATSSLEYDPLKFAGAIMRIGTAAAAARRQARKPLKIKTTIFRNGDMLTYVPGLRGLYTYVVDRCLRPLLRLFPLTGRTEAEMHNFFEDYRRGVTFAADPTRRAQLENYRVLMRAREHLFLKLGTALAEFASNRALGAVAPC